MENRAFAPALLEEVDVLLLKIPLESLRAAHQQRGRVCLHGVPSWQHSTTPSSAVWAGASIVLRYWVVISRH
jgi:hypothetical protein